MNLTHKFKPGDIIRSCLRSPVEVIEIREGVPSDFVGRVINHTGMPCYVTQHLVSGRETVFSCVSVDSDHHLKGSELFNLYEIQ